MAANGGAECYGSFSVIQKYHFYHPFYGFKPRDVVKW